MNTAPVYRHLNPTWRMLWQQIRTLHGIDTNRRAERLVMRYMAQGWKSARLEALLQRLLRHDATPRSERSRHTNLGQVIGCDQPVSARASYPKTPAAREQVCSVAAVGRNADDISACGTVPRHRGAIV